MGLPTTTIVHLRAAGVSLALDLRGPHPEVLHWGSDLGDLDHDALEALAFTAGAARLHNAPDVPRRFGLLAGEDTDWAGTPSLAGHRAGRGTTPRLRATDAVVTPSGAADATGGGSVELLYTDEVRMLGLRVRIALTPEGLVELDQTLTSTASPEAPVYDLSRLTARLPVPSRAAELLDFTGKWSRERQPQRIPLVDGSHVRESRRGKPGADSAYLMALGTPGFGSRHGEVWAVHVAWSGDQQWFAERLPEGAGVFSAALGGGELVRPGEVRLTGGESYTAPRLVFSYSGEGLDGVADRFHGRVRSTRRRAGAQPLVLNTWEAVYFDHQLPRLLELVDRAARVGVERIVLDDGWFRGRRGDDAGLGDWQIDEAVWPGGLDPFVDRVREHGMQFGLWFEPEMVNLDSELAREHPEWILGPAEGLGSSFRNQYVVDLAHPEAFTYLLESISALVSRYSIDFLKWDHNRELAEAVRRSDGGSVGVRSQTLALYALLDDLRMRFPLLEIESCASGGGRVDLGVLERTDRVWTSDCNDPVERQSIQRWSELLLPPELLGSHVGAPRSHTTHRVADQSFRLATTLFASAGVEWDLTACTDAELDDLARWASLYKETRALVATGRRVHADLADAETALHGSVAADGSRALFAWVRLGTSRAGQAGRVPFPGLAEDAVYEVRVRDELGAVALHEVSGPAWFEAARGAGAAAAGAAAAAAPGADAAGSIAPAAPLRVPGSILARVGLPLPTLEPAQALLLDFVRVA
ncbi:alpha-galactosidase [Herbiconiux moechotypicola]|uniref:alpha-galactosidase n=1 Tax=Herbiconiux moechotypicola TaxID=637393 RepID=A0ABN3DCV1_9MICO|nr:alpha-galactosidase [Herbiconiux moechotypicola]MCS5728716.1 alpha-galactosidase [Herbiconiux moechotypicola]